VRHRPTRGARTYRIRKAEHPENVRAVLRISNGALAADVRRAFERIGRSLSTNEAEEIVKVGLRAAEQVMSVRAEASRAELIRAFRHAAELAAKAALEQVRVDAVFGGGQEAAAARAATTAAKLVVEITLEQRDLLRGIVAEGLQAGTNPKVVAQEIRHVVGLHERWAKAVLNYRRGLEAQGLPDARVEKLTKTYHDRLVRVRAQTIARTEMLRASNEAQHEAWKAAARAGELDTKTLLRRWIATEDDRTDEICANLDGTEIAFDDSFSYGEPPVHPRCRCSIGLVAKR